MKNLKSKNNNINKSFNRLTNIYIKGDLFGCAIYLTMLGIFPWIPLNIIWYYVILVSLIIILIMLMGDSIIYGKNELYHDYYNLFVEQINTLTDKAKDLEKRTSKYKKKAKDYKDIIESQAPYYIVDNGEFLIDEKSYSLIAFKTIQEARKYRDKYNKNLSILRIKTTIKEED